MGLGQEVEQVRARLLRKQGEFSNPQVHQACRRSDRLFREYEREPRIAMSISL